jgi:uncharacterized protein (DUF2267 family)
MIHFQKFAQEGNEFINDLSDKLGHPGDLSQTGILFRAVLHTLRDRITVAQSLNLISQFPMFIKALYVEQWKYKDPTKIKNMDEFCEAVEHEQKIFKETRFDWPESTEELTKIVFHSLEKYLSPGQIEDVVAELPSGLKHLFEYEPAVK